MSEKGELRFVMRGTKRILQQYLPVLGWQDVPIIDETTGEPFVPGG